MGDHAKLSVVCGRSRGSLHIFILFLPGGQKYRRGPVRLHGNSSYSNHGKVRNAIPAIYRNEQKYQNEPVIGYPLGDNQIKVRNRTRFIARCLLSTVGRFLSASPTTSRCFDNLAQLAVEFSTALLRPDIYSLS